MKRQLTNSTTKYTTLITAIFLLFGTASAADGTISADNSFINISTDAKFTVDDADNPNPAIVGFNSSTEGIVVDTSETFSGDGSTTTFTVSNTPLADTNGDGTIAGDEVTQTGSASETVSSVNPQTGEVTLSATPSDSSNNVEITYDHHPESVSVDASSGSATASIPVTTSSDVNGEVEVTDGETVTAQYWDASPGAYRTASLTIDDSKPTATIDSNPSAVQPDDTSVSVDYTLNEDISSVSSATLTFKDSNGDTIQKTLSGSDLSTGSNSATFDLTQLPDGLAGTGTYDLNFEATDSAGNTQTDSATGTVDGTNPNVAINSVDPSTVESGDSPTVKYNLTDGESGVDTISSGIRIYNTSLSGTIGSFGATEGEKQSQPVNLNSNVQQGDYTVKVDGNDNAGNTNISTKILTVDNVVADGSLTVTGDPVQSDGTITVDGTASSKADDITFQLDNGTATDTVTKEISNQGFSVSIDLSARSISFSEGTVDIAAEQEDSFSSADDSTTFEVDETFDGINSVSLSATPVSDSETGNGNEVTVTVDGKEDFASTADFTVTPDNNGNLTTAPTVENKRLDAGNFKFDLEFTDDNEDVENVELKVAGGKDAAGNTMSDTTKNYDVDTKNPEVSSALYADSDNDGSVDEVNVTFSESVSYSPSDVSIGGDWKGTDTANLPGFTLESKDTVNGATVSLDVTTNSDVTGVLQKQSEPSIDISTGSRVTDDNGNIAATTSEATMTDEADPVIDFGEGLTMVSFPSTVGSYSLDTLLDNQENVGTSDIEAIWAYGDSGWINYDPDQDNNDLETVEGGQGYMIKAESGASGKIIADVDAGDEDTMTPSTVGLTTNRWNLVGHYEETPQSVSNAGASGLDASYIDQLIKRDGSGSYTGHSSDVMPGDAYWASANAEDTYEPQFAP